MKVTGNNNENAKRRFKIGALPKELRRAMDEVLGQRSQRGQRGF